MNGARPHTRRIRLALALTRFAGPVLAGLFAAGCASEGPNRADADRHRRLPTNAGSQTGSNIHRSETLGTSVEGTPITRVTLGSGPTRVLLIGNIHGDEPEGLAAYDGVLRMFHDLGLGTRLTLHAIRTVNPDGLRAHTRTNASGVDLNRNFPASNFKGSETRGETPLSEPEARAIHAQLALNPDLIVVLHSARTGPFVDPDGPADALAVAFVEAASLLDQRWRVVPVFTNPPGSLGTYAGLELGIPMLTVEFRRGDSTDKATRPGVAGLLRVLREIANEPQTATD